jgi:hypothetical protein
MLFDPLFQELGATVERGGLRFGLSHMIWSHGNPKLVRAAQLMDIVVVSPLWVEQCREARARVNEADFYVYVGSAPGELSAAHPPVPRSMAPATTTTVTLPVARSILIPSIALSPAKKYAMADLEPHIDQAKSLRDPESPFFSSSQRQLMQNEEGGEEGDRQPSVAAEDWRKDKASKQRLRKDRTPRRDIVVLEKRALIHSALDITQNGVKHIIIDSASYEHLKAIEDDLVEEMDAIKNASSSPLAIPQFRRIPTPERIPIPPVPLPLIDAGGDNHIVKRRRFSERLCDFRSDSDEDTIDARSKPTPVAKSSKASTKKTPSPPVKAVVRKRVRSSAPALAVPAASTPQREPPKPTLALDAQKIELATTGPEGDAAQGAESTQCPSSSIAEPARPWWINTRTNARTSHISSVSSRRLRGSGMKIAFSGFGRDEDFLTLSSIASAVELRYLDAASSRPGSIGLNTSWHRRPKKGDGAGSDSDEDEDSEEIAESLLVLGESPCLLTPSENLDVDYPCSIIVKKIEHTEKTGYE